MGDAPAVAILVAAGMGVRLGSGVPKALALLESDNQDSSLLSIVTRRFVDTQLFSNVFIAAPPKFEEQFRESLAAFEEVEVYRGGATRQESVRLGCEHLAKYAFPDDTLVLVHDVARCLIGHDLLQNSLIEARKSSAVSATVPVSDSLVSSSESVHLGSPVPRENLFFVQTPQVFTFGLLARAHQDAYQNNILATDDAQLVRKYHPVTAIAGDSVNFKITSSSDLELARLVWRSQCDE